MLAENTLITDDEMLVDSLIEPGSYSELFMRMNNLATAIQINKDDVVSQRELISVLNTLGYSREAKLMCERALSIAPDDVEVHVSYAKCLLSLGEYELAWKEYEWRMKLPGAIKVPTKGQLWDRIARKGQKLLLLADVSIAEIALNARYCSLLSDYGMSIVIQAPAEWHRYFDAIPGVKQCVVNANELNAEWYFPIGSLSQVFSIKADDVPSVEQYVFPSDEAIFSWFKTLEAEKEKLKVGICWRDELGKISCPINELEQFTKIPDVSLVSLVRNPTAEERAWLEQHNVKQVLQSSHDWMDVALCAKCLDLVLTVESECLSAAAGMGVPVWAWHSPAPEWMWCLGVKSNAWYPTVRSVRQTRVNDWSPLIDASYRTLMRAIQETGLS